jgi:5-methylcytosine-specific restriction endonuclease McrBC regulatory subunit McrC
VELRSAERVVWIDAKYKPHLELLERRDWHALSEEVRAEHRADLHQALAYASLADVSQVDTLLLYPQIGRELDPVTTATVTSGRRRVRLVLASVPFGYSGPDQQERCLRRFRELLAA